MENQNKSSLQVFFHQMKEDPALQTEFRRHMGQTMRGMEGDIGTMQSAMNARIAQGFLSYAEANGYEISAEELNALLAQVNTGLHKKMGQIFEQEFAAAVGRLMV